MSNEATQEQQRRREIWGGDGYSLLCPPKCPDCGAKMAPSIRDFKVKGWVCFDCSDRSAEGTAD